MKKKTKEGQINIMLIHKFSACHCQSKLFELISITIYIKHRVTHGRNSVLIIGSL